MKSGLGRLNFTRGWKKLLMLEWFIKVILSGFGHFKYGPRYFKSHAKDKKTQKTHKVNFKITTSLFFVEKN